MVFHYICYGRHAISGWFPVFGGTAVTDAKVATWNTDDAITHNPLSMCNDIMEPDDVINSDDIIFWRRWKACAQNVEKGTHMKIVCTPKRAPL